MRNPFVVLALLVAASYSASAIYPFGLGGRQPQGYLKVVFPARPQYRYYEIARNRHLLEAIRHIVMAGSLRQDEVMRKASERLRPWTPSNRRLPKIPPVVMPMVGSSASPTKISMPIPIPPPAPAVIPEKTADVPMKEPAKEIIALAPGSKEKIKSVINELEENMEQDIQKAADDVGSVAPPKVTQEVIEKTIAKVEEIVHQSGDDSDLRSEMQTEAPAVNVAVSAVPDAVVLVDVAEKQEVPKEETPKEESPTIMDTPEKPSESKPEKSGTETLKKLITQLGSSLTKLMGAMDQMVKTG